MQNATNASKCKCKYNNASKCKMQMQQMLQDEKYNECIKIKNAKSIKIQNTNATNSSKCKMQMQKMLQGL